MIYRSTNKLSPNVDFREAAVTGLAPDNGLFFPIEVPFL